MSGPRLDIDLDAFAANIAAVRDRVAPAQLMLVVKDDAYGHGLEPIVRRASAEGVRWFGAFDVREAVLDTRRVARSRRAGLLVAHGRRGRDRRGSRQPTSTWASGTRTSWRRSPPSHAGSRPPRGCISRWIPGCIATASDRRIGRHGHRRARALADSGVISLVGVWSHIAEASDEEDDAARAAFDAAVATAEAAGFDLEVRHLSASAAAFARPEFRYDLVRVGAFCYGIRSAGGPDEPELRIRPIASLRAPVDARGRPRRHHRGRLAARTAVDARETGHARRRGRPCGRATSR